MVGTAKTMCILSVAVVLVVSVAYATTVGDIVEQFKEFGPKYVDYRKMKNKPAERKEVVFQELLTTVKTNNWANFHLGSIDMETFSLDSSKTFFGQFNVIFDPDCEGIRLRGIAPSSLFQDHLIDHPNHSNLQNIEKFVKRKFSLNYKTEENKVAFHSLMFNGKDLSKQKNSDARKEYMLILLATATE